VVRRVVLVQHDRGPADDRVHTCFLGHGFEPVMRRPFAGEALPASNEGIAGSVIYGGGFEAYATNRYPFLKEEVRWIEACIASDIPLLGICQGAQQFAHVLGARVGPPSGGEHEFGYCPLYPTEAGKSILAAPIHVTQSHFHTFGLPAGAVHLASSDLFENQAFSYGKTTYAFQFHAEVTPEGFRRWQERPGAPFGKFGVQEWAEQDRLMELHDAVQEAWFFGFLDRLFGPAA
jgi:GMP synthase (glutamine-hydrolysing)